MRLSNEGTSILKPVSASTRGMRARWRRLEPSRVKVACFFSRMTNTTSWAVPVLPISSPSPANVIFVPAFQPGLTSTSRTASASRCRVDEDLLTFIFFVVPLKSSSREQASSKTAGRMPPPFPPPWPPIMPPKPPSPPPMPMPPKRPPMPSNGDSPKELERSKESLKKRAKMSLGSPWNWYAKPPGTPPPAGPSEPPGGAPPLRPSSPN
mmetsp:Transcript_66224/g.209358  ORF Transcript_66224/g.209358 Transcript_66224/m.209358 type:complete len:209 (+) Transcript_66224:481-1107(+)